MYRGIWEDGEGKPAHRLDWPFTTAHPGRGWENPIPLPIVLFALLCAHRLTRVPARRSLSRTAGLGTNDFGGELILLLFFPISLFPPVCCGPFFIIFYGRRKYFTNFVLLSRFVCFADDDHDVRALCATGARTSVFFFSARFSPPTERVFTRSF